MRIIFYLIVLKPLLESIPYMEETKDLISQSGQEEEPAEKTSKGILI
jgi:hypothetical protein